MILLNLKYRTTIFFFICLQAALHGQSISVNKFETFLKNHKAEKAYLHFDKPYYVGGDTVYFKAYLVWGERHQLSDLSRILYVDLINPKGQIDQSIKLQLIGGVGWGDFALPDSLTEGNYRIRAYTRWMRNDGNGDYFDETIPVGSVLKNKITESTSRQLKLIQNVKADLQFFPEGGTLVTGVRSKVAFKAIGINGLSIGVKGVIIDNDNREVVSFQSAHLGMGYFYFIPQKGKTYKAKVTFANTTQTVIDLAKPDVKGIVLSVNNDSLSKASVKIETNDIYFKENKDKDYLLHIYSGGLVTTVTCKLDSQVLEIDIHKRHLRTGVTTITLFSPTNEPLCERLLFVQNYDQLNMEIKSDKTIYYARGKVDIRLSVRNRADEPTLGHFSVSVIDENKVSLDENAMRTILTNFLLTSDLKGYVEQPNYYFAKINDTTQSQLDLVMLTNGYRRFEWKKLLNDEYPPINFQAEKGIEISGKVKNLGGKPLVKGTVSLISPNGLLLTQQSDEHGHFHFSNLLFQDSAKFILQAVNAKGKNFTQIVYDKESAPSISMKTPVQNEDIDQVMLTYLQNSKAQSDNYLKYGGPKGKILKEVKIKAIKRDDNYRSSSLAGPGHADQVMHADEIENMGGPLSDRLNGRLRGVVFGRSGAVLTVFHTGPMLLVLDGQPMPSGFSLDNINGSDVETVEVLKYSSASIYGMQGGNGVLVITTKQGTGKQLKDITSTGILPITAIGFHKAREFYSPKYEHPELTNRKDLRSTIYWKPEIVTDKDGNASFEYYNADGSGNYLVVIEGVDEKGNIGHQVYRYKVE